MVELKVFESIDEISEVTLSKLLDIGVKGTAALSFGSTYTEIFKRWKKEIPRLGSQRMLPSFFPADERIVPFSDPGSNWGAAVRLFLSDCGTEEDINRFASDIDTYKKMLTDYFHSDMPVFDLIFLGIGPDGHTASLFPDSCPDEGSKNWYSPVLETTAPFNPPDRLTLGPEIIASARTLVITITGETKSEIFKDFFYQVNSPVELAISRDLLPPVKIIRRREALGLDTLIIADRGAAEALPWFYRKEFKGNQYEIQKSRSCRAGREISYYNSGSFGRSCKAQTHSGAFSAP